MLSGHKFPWFFSINEPLLECVVSASLKSPFEVGISEDVGLLASSSFSLTITSMASSKTRDGEDRELEERPVAARSSSKANQFEFVNRELLKEHNR